MVTNIIFIETPQFMRKIDRIASPDDLDDLQKELIKQPFKGDLVRGTGGARKIRMKLPGRGKRDSARVIYYYVDLRGELWLLDVYQKNERDSLSDIEKMRLYTFIKEEINEQK
jgi:hypothetical protein